jgi:hypothetical protein
VTALLSSISGQFGKSLILGTLLPSALFIFLGFLFLPALVPGDWLFLAQLQVVDPQWQVLALSIMSVVVASALYFLNTPIVRVYEGYPWRDSAIGEWRTEYYNRKFNALAARGDGLRTLRNKLEMAEGKSSTNYTRVYKKHVRGELERVSEFPSESRLVLPTQLGNVMRSFESYPARQYGMDAVTLWPRLVAKLPPDYASGLEGAETSFHFMINSSALSALLALTLLIVGLFNGTAWTSPGTFWWLLEIVILLVVAWRTYAWGIGRAKAYGDLVKGAFDLFRWDLLKQLGYKQVPVEVEKEQGMWEQISRQLVYGYAPQQLRAQVPPLDYADQAPPASPVSSDTEGATFTLARGVTPLPGERPHGTVRVTLFIGNKTDADTVTNVVVTETPPAGYAYKWGSARAVSKVSNDDVNKDVVVTGTQAYKFAIALLVRNEQVTLTYDAFPYHRQDCRNEKEETGE